MPTIDQDIKVIIEANLDQLRDSNFVYNKILCGEPGSKLYEVRKEALRLRIMCEDIEIARLQRETVERQNEFLRWYTILTAVIAVATVVNTIITIKSALI